MQRITFESVQLIWIWSGAGAYPLTGRVGTIKGKKYKKTKQKQERARAHPVWLDADFLPSADLRSANLRDVTPCITPWQPDVSATGVGVTEKSHIHKSLNPSNETSQGQRGKKEGGKWRGLQRWRVEREMTIFSALHCFIQRTAAEQQEWPERSKKKKLLKQLSFHLLFLPFFTASPLTRRRSALRFCWMAPLLFFTSAWSTDRTRLLK